MFVVFDPAAQVARGGHRLTVDGDDDVAVRLEYAPGRWCTILSIEDWNMPPYVALANMIRDAIAYGELRASTIEADDERGPPGGGDGEAIREVEEGEAML